MRSFAAIWLAKSIGYVGIFWAGPIAWFGGAAVVIVGYFWTINHLNPKKMRRIFTKKHQLNHSAPRS
jgi:hypothetical protein